MKLRSAGVAGSFALVVEDVREATRRPVRREREGEEARLVRHLGLIPDIQERLLLETSSTSSGITRIRPGCSTTNTSRVSPGGETTRSGRSRVPTAVRRAAPETTVAGSDAGFAGAEAGTAARTPRVPRRRPVEPSGRARHVWAPCAWPPGLACARLARCTHTVSDTGLSQPKTVTCSCQGVHDDDRAASRGVLASPLPSGAVAAC